MRHNIPANGYIHPTCGADHLRYVTTLGKVRDKKLPPSALDEFKGVTLGREKYPLLTDYKKIKWLADAGISIVEFYAKPGGAR